eukprot:CAMPEP_0180339190 /NCGR_PEP_ID=MMETSP0988-20121125/46337_1 /TAXON_ID=697907 /ORGANISM="non described non described, Strain CCMP2293" /LENGTH=94 /DNA_ID=CAMNT_0022327693 /DNA_START=229 /DNA_END=513 /DNA_ORIENTATION=-
MSPVSPSRSHPSVSTWYVSSFGVGQQSSRSSPCHDLNCRPSICVTRASALCMFPTRHHASTAMLTAEAVSGSNFFRISFSMFSALPGCGGRASR